MDIILAGLKPRLMLILYNKNNWLSVKMIDRILKDSFKAGGLAKPYSYNRICITLRELNMLGLIEKKGSSPGTWGRSQLYKITLEGTETMRDNMLIPKEAAQNAGLVV